MKWAVGAWAKTKPSIQQSLRLTGSKEAPSGLAQGEVSPGGTKGSLATGYLMMNRGE